MKGWPKVYSTSRCRQALQSNKTHGLPNPIGLTICPPGWGGEAGEGREGFKWAEGGQIVEWPGPRRGVETAADSVALGSREAADWVLKLQSCTHIPGGKPH